MAVKRRKVRVEVGYNLDMRLDSRCILTSLDSVSSCDLQCFLPRLAGAPSPLARPERRGNLACLRGAPYPSLESSTIGLGAKDFHS